MDEKITPVAASKMTVEEAKANLDRFLIGSSGRGYAHDTLLNAIERAAATNPPQGFANTPKEF